MRPSRVTVNFSAFQEGLLAVRGEQIFQKSSQKGDMKQIQFRGTKNVRRHNKIWSRRGDLLPDICTFLIRTMS
jgi:hypothetical protein